MHIIALMGTGDIDRSAGNVLPEVQLVVTFEME
jgi:hypothetical protein